MPAQLKNHGEVQLKEASARVEDSIVAEFEGVRIYARRNSPGLPPSLNGSHHLREPIERIAERLHALGYAVKIERFDLGGVKLHDFQAVWTVGGEPPSLPFQ